MNVTLEEVRRAFEEHRRNRRPGARHPNRLWQVALDACLTNAPSKVAKVAGLDYYQLQTRLSRVNRVPQLTCSEVVEVESNRSAIEAGCESTEARALFQITNPSGFSICFFEGDETFYRPYLESFFKQC